MEIQAMESILGDDWTGAGSLMPLSPPQGLSVFWGLKPAPCAPALSEICRLLQWWMDPVHQAGPTVQLAGVCQSQLLRNRKRLALIQASDAYCCRLQRAATRTSCSTCSARPLVEQVTLMTFRGLWLAVTAGDRKGTCRG